MDTSIVNEKQLLTEIDQLREQFSQTQDLYREVCVLLFFRYGITPTANKLYQLVRKGSMSAPAEALNKFWENLREKSRLRIEHPDLPEALKAAAGELTAALWMQSQKAAHDSLASYRAEAQAMAVEAKAATATAETERDTARQALQEMRQSLNQANARIATLEQQLAATNAVNTGLKEQLQQEQAENQALGQRLEDVRKDFTMELDKLRVTAELAEERFRGAEKRALLEIDRERGAALKLQKELEAARSLNAEAAERHRSELASLQDQLGNLMQKNGMLEGSLQAVAANRDAAANDLKAVQQQLSDATAHLSLVRAEAENWRRQAEECRQAAKRQESAKAISGSRKSRPNP